MSSELKDPTPISPGLIQMLCSQFILFSTIQLSSFQGLLPILLVIATVRIEYGLVEACGSIFVIISSGLVHLLKEETLTHMSRLHWDWVGPLVLFCWNLTWTLVIQTCRKNYAAWHQKASFIQACAGLSALLLVFVWFQRVSMVSSFLLFLFFFSGWSNISFLSQLVSSEQEQSATLHQIAICLSPLILLLSSFVLHGF